MHALAATIGSPHVALLSIRLMHAKKCPAACSNGRIRVEEFGMQDWFVTCLLSSSEKSYLYHTCGKGKGNTGKGGKGQGGKGGLVKVAKESQG